MLDNILDDEDEYKMLSEQEDNKLSNYTWSKIGLYYDETMPLGGWNNEIKREFW